MIRLQKLMIAVLSVLSLPVAAQRSHQDPTEIVPRAQISLGYNFVHANAPPSGCQCFDLNGGYLDAGVPIKFWLSAAGRGTYATAGNISALGQNLHLATVAGGPRITFRRTYIVPFADALFGIAHASDSYFPRPSGYSTGATSFAVDSGAGVDFRLNQTFGIRPIEARYLHTGFPNGVNDSQNHFTLSAGITISFHGRPAMHSSHASQPKSEHLALACSANFRTVEQGQILELSASARGYVSSDLSYTWTADSGDMHGSGPIALLSTEGLAAGRYHASAHASLTSDPSITSDCDVPFRVVDSVKPVAVAPPPPPAPPATSADLEFHQNVRDALFDYDKWNLRPDATQAIGDAAAYLNAHPELRVLIGGYSDERGSTTYNLALGEKRANATRDALIQAGIDPARLQTVSFGKGAQVCTAEDEKCYQQNRRAAFMLHP